MRKRLVDIFLKVTNKQIIRARAGKRLKQIKKRFAENAVVNREDCKKLVAQDWKESLNVRSVGTEADEENISNVRFKFSFNKSAIQADIQLPIEYETNIASFMEKIDAQPVINFDDLQPFEEIEKLEFEVEKYQKFRIPQISNYEPQFIDKQIRLGCEYESVIRQLSGEPDL